MFSQSRYVLTNAPGAKNRYVSADLRKINPGESDHPEKDAYMMQRAFRIWEEIFQGPNRDRLIRVAAVQQSWYDNTKRILEYLFKKDGNGNPITNNKVQTSLGKGCDAVSPAGYFTYTDQDKAKWLNMSPSSVTPEVIIKAVDAAYEAESGIYTEKNAEYAQAWGVDFVVYEGGQHILPLQQQQNSPYNNAIWDAQIYPKIYDLYMKALSKHASPKVNCKLFCAYNYISDRKSIWGSWGHIESLNQLQQPGQLKQTAPKYAAIIDANID